MSEDSRILLSQLDDEVRPRNFTRSPSSFSKMDQLKKEIREEMAMRWEGNTYVGDVNRKTLIEGPEFEIANPRRTSFDLINGWTFPAEE